MKCQKNLGSAENNYDNTTTGESGGGETYWNVPVTEPPRSIRNEKDSLVPSAPPADEDEDQLLLANDDDLRDFTSGMSVTTSNGNRRVKVNCCNALLKQCLELIDVKASAVLGSEDIEDLDISAVKMIVCRDTLSVEKEAEVYAALLRWSTRECKRQRMELTAENRRNVLVIIFYRQCLTCRPTHNGHCLTSKCLAIVFADLHFHRLYFTIKIFVNSYTYGSETSK